VSCAHLVHVCTGKAVGVRRLLNAVDAAAQEGGTSEFIVRGTDIGNVTRIQLRIVPSDTDPSWQLDSVQVI
jgi:hypothetical protein